MTLRKRFYKTAGIVACKGGYQVVLDERKLHTPAKAPVVLESESLAQAIAEEWRNQGDDINPAAMALTRLVNTAIDRIKSGRKDVISSTLAYGETDLLCYRTEYPQDLAQRQQDCWQPLVDWLETAYGVRLLVTYAITPERQNPEALKVLGAVLEGLSEHELNALANIASASASLVIALAVLGGRIDAEKAFQATHLEETFQNAQWGEDEEAEERREALRLDIHTTVRYLSLARDV
jgi:chaperone required for assembly of F1-ATPase